MRNKKKNFKKCGIKVCKLSKFLCSLQFLIPRFVWKFKNDLHPLISLFPESLVDLVKIELGKKFKYPWQWQFRKANSRKYVKEVNRLWNSLTLEK